jgi:hypothetical protein
VYDEVHVVLCRLHTDRGMDPPRGGVLCSEVVSNAAGVGRCDLRELAQISCTRVLTFSVCEAPHLCLKAIERPKKKKKKNKSSTFPVRRLGVHLVFGSIKSLGFY